MRLPTHLLVTALVRRANDSGGFGVVLAKGDPQAGAILTIGGPSEQKLRVMERGIGPSGAITLIDTTPPGDITDYWRRRRDADPDLWVIELISASAERFAAETILDD